MDQATAILTRLIDRYEGSTAFTGGKGRVYLDARRDSDLFCVTESSLGKEGFLGALRDLSEKGLVTYTWVHGEDGNLVDRISLNLDDGALSSSYRFLGRIPLRTRIDSLVSLLDSSLEHLHESHLSAFVRGEVEMMKKRSRLSRFFYGDEVMDARLVEALVFLSDNRQQIYERVMSSRLYHDSKFFERKLRGKVLSILKQALKDVNVDNENDDEYWSYFNVARYPEVLALKGQVRIHYRNGDVTSAGRANGTLYIDTFSLEMIDRIEILDSRVLFIENKASFYNFPDTEDLTTIYHGGFFGLAKARFFSLVGEARCSFFHFSDIDLGGFMIFVRLRSIIPSLVPYRMDRRTLEENIDSAMMIEGEDYLKKLGALLDDEEYAPFHETIMFMLERKVRLEQESLVLEAFWSTTCRTSLQA